MSNKSDDSTAVIAFSGGLDTSFLVPWVRERYAFKTVITCTADTGGFSEAERAEIAARSRELGATKHVFVNCEQEYFDEILRYLIFGNVTRDGYPLCVGAERVIQARAVLQVALAHQAKAVVHGSTGAGNDQFRFDTAIHVLGKGRVACLAPIRDDSITRPMAAETLRKHGYSVPAGATEYSYNVGLWGVSIGGAETHDAASAIPDSAWYSQVTPNAEPMTIRLEFECGVPIALDWSEGRETTAVAIIKTLGQIGANLAVGRRYHVGTSIIGKKGRIAYESPAADILYEAHRTIERITLTQHQIFGKRQAGEEFGRLLHEARFFEPYLEDLKALLTSSQRRVSGTATVKLVPRGIEFVGVQTPNDLLRADGARYGESSELYDGRDASGACKLHSLEQRIYHALS